jgi:hypothetical protein
VKFWRLETVDLFSFEAFFDDFEVTFVDLDIVDSLIDMFLMPEISTVSECKYFEVLLIFIISRIS